MESLHTKRARTSVEIFPSFVGFVGELLVDGLVLSTSAEDDEFVLKDVVGGGYRADEQQPGSAIRAGSQKRKFALPGEECRSDAGRRKRAMIAAVSKMTTRAKTRTPHFCQTRFRRDG